jgi:hypothetical protein
MGMSKIECMIEYYKSKNEIALQNHNNFENDILECLNDFSYLLEKLKVEEEIQLQLKYEIRVVI